MVDDISHVNNLEPRDSSILSTLPSHHPHPSSRPPSTFCHSYLYSHFELEDQPQSATPSFITTTRQTLARTMDAMDIDHDVSSATKRKADEVPLHSTTPEVNISPNTQDRPRLTKTQSKRLKPTDSEPEARSTTPNSQLHLQLQDQQQQNHQAQSSSTTTTTTSQIETYHISLRAEFHHLNKQLITRRDIFHYDAALYENLSYLYENLSETIQRSPERSEMNDWAENLCVMLLEVLIRMETEMREIEMVEGRLWRILWVLRGNV